MPRVAFVFFLHFWAQRLTLWSFDFAQRDDVAPTLVALRFNDATLIVLDCLLITWYTFYFHLKGKVCCLSAFVGDDQLACHTLNPINLIFGVRCCLTRR